MMSACRRQIGFLLGLVAGVAAGLCACKKSETPKHAARRSAGSPRRRGRRGQAHAQPPPRSAPPSVLLVDAGGGIVVRSIEPAAIRQRLFAKVRVAALEDLSQAGGVLAIVARARGRDSLVLLREGRTPKQIATHAVYAAFAPDGRKLLVVTRRRRHLGGGAAGTVEHTAVYDLVADRLRSLGGYAQPRWEADGVHLRATRLEPRVTVGRVRSQVRWRCNRVRINSVTKAVSSIGPGDAQLPAPAGSGLVWRVASERPALPASEHGDRCRLSLGGSAPSLHAVEGALCLGLAADRGVRWSADGRWLAFASFASAGARKLPPRFLQIVSLEGRPHPAVAALRQETHASAVDSLAGYPWIDWSPAGDRLGLVDPGGQVAIYQLRPPRVISVGKGRAPRWSPDGRYLLLLRPSGDTPAVAEAVIIEASSRRRRRSLGPARDARWLRPIERERPQP